MKSICVRLADPAFCQERFATRFASVRRAAQGVRVASMSVLARELADETLDGVRSAPDAERLIGSLILIGIGASDAYARPALFVESEACWMPGTSWRPDSETDTSVDLGSVVESAITAVGWYR